MKNDRIWGLDLIRAFAVLSVLVIHTADLTPDKMDGFINTIRFDGVLYFFVLSGFLIGNILIRSFEKSLKFTDVFNFWVRRWFRTLPNYFLFLILLMLLLGEYKLRIIKYIFFTQNFYKPISDFFPESWSLAIEEWFYLLLPLSILLINKMLKISVKRSLFVIIISVVLISPIIRFLMSNYYHVNDFISWDFHIRSVAICRFDSIIWGLFGAFISYYYSAIWVKYKKTLLVFGLVGIIFIKALELKFGWEFMHSQSTGIMALYLTIQPLLILTLLPFLSTFKVNKENTFTKSITKVSLISYSIYLVNYSLVKGYILHNLEKIFNSYIPVDYLTIILVVLFWLLSVSIPLFIYKYYELPMMNLRDKIKFERIKNVFSKK